jgi:myxalamid-type polyketide synthase MxaE and MxaD
MEQMYIANQDEYQAPFWAECELLDYEAEKIEGEGVVGNFTLYDNGGNVIAKSYNFRLGRKLKEITNPPLYELMWQKRALPALTHKNKDLQTTLIFSQGDKLSKAITQELRNFGHRVITIMPKFAFKADYKQGVLEAIYINPTQQADFISIAEVLKQEHITVNQIVYGWALQDKIDNERDIADVEHRLSFYNLGVLYLMQSYQHFPILPTTRLDILTVGAYPVEEGQATKSIASTTLWGLAKVIRQEYPTLACQTIDTMGYTTELDAKNLAYQLLYQMPEPEIALRKDSLYLPRLQNVLEEYVSKTPVELQAESTYMWVGSPNLLALAFIEWLAYKGAKNIVWIHQTLPSDNSTGLFMYLKKNDVKLTLIQIEDLDETSLEDCLENIRAKMPPLKGIFYAPVYTKQITLQDLDAQILGETWVEKIHGAWNLHRLTLQDNLEHFVMFSSANSLLGAPKTGAEVLANNALDALAHYRAGQNLPALSINWGTVVEAQEQPIPYIQEVDAKRYTMFFEKVLEAGMTQVGIFHLTSLPQTPYYELIKLTHKPIEQVVENTVTISKFEEWCLFTDRHKQMQWLEAQIREQTAIILKSSPNKVNVNTPFKTLGIDSIMTVQLRNLLEKTFDLKLPVSSFFSYSSIKEYTKFLDEQLCSILPAPAVKEITPKPTRAEKTEQTAAAPIQDFSAMSLEELSKALDEELSGAL